MHFIGASGPRALAHCLEGAKRVGRSIAIFFYDRRRTDASDLNGKSAPAVPCHGISVAGGSCDVAACLLPTGALGLFSCTYQTFRGVGRCRSFKEQPSETRLCAPKGRNTGWPLAAAGGWEAVSQLHVDLSNHGINRRGFLAFSNMALTESGPGHVRGVFWPSTDAQIRALPTEYYTLVSRLVVRKGMGNVISEVEGDISLAALLPHNPALLVLSTEFGLRRVAAGDPSRGIFALEPANMSIQAGTQLCIVKMFPSRQQDRLATGDLPGLVVTGEQIDHPLPASFAEGQDALISLPGDEFFYCETESAILNPGFAVRGVRVGR